MYSKPKWKLKKKRTNSTADKMHFFWQIPGFKGNDAQGILEDAEKIC